MDVKKEAEERVNKEAKLSMPLWKWVAIGVGVLVAFVVLAYCAVS